jgi:hypothetical protein
MCECVVQGTCTYIQIMPSREPASRSRGFWTPFMNANPPGCFPQGTHSKGACAAPRDVFPGDANRRGRNFGACLDHKDSFPKDCFPLGEGTLRPIYGAYGIFPLGTADPKERVSLVAYRGPGEPLPRDCTCEAHNPGAYEALGGVSLGEPFWKRL